MAPSQRRPVTLVAGALWLVLWTAGLFVAGWLMLTSLSGGDWAPALFLAVWLGVAALALYRVGLGLLETLTGERLRPAPRRRRHERPWRDGISGGGEP